VNVRFCYVSWSDKLTDDKRKFFESESVQGPDNIAFLFVEIHLFLENFMCEIAKGAAPQDRDHLDVHDLKIQQCVVPVEADISAPEAVGEEEMREPGVLKAVHRC